MTFQRPSLSLAPITTLVVAVILLAGDCACHEQEPARVSRGHEQEPARVTRIGHRTALTNGQIHLKRDAGRNISTAGTVGGAIAAFVVLVAVILILIWRLRQRKRQASAQFIQSEDDAPRGPDEFDPQPTVNHELDPDPMRHELPDHRHDRSF